MVPPSSYLLESDSLLGSSSGAPSPRSSQNQSQIAGTKKTRQKEKAGDAARNKKGDSQLEELRKSMQRIDKVIGGGGNAKNKKSIMPINLLGIPDNSLELGDHLHNSTLKKQQSEEKKTGKNQKNS